MKTNLLKLLTATATICLMLLCTSNAKAQISNPYNVKNYLQCPITVSYVVKQPLGTTCVTNCDSGTINVPASSNTYITITGCASICNIIITLTAVGGVPLGSSISVDANNTTNGTATNCSGSNMSWFTDATVIQ